MHVYESAYDIIHKTGKYRVKLRIIIEYLCMYANAIFFLSVKKITGNKWGKIIQRNCILLKDKCQIK